MASIVKYLGIDLGTTNSAVAVFADGKVKTVLNARGEVNTPSVVRTTKNGVVVGSKAKKHLYSDAANTFKEFKRLMGAQSLSEADLNGDCWSAVALSTEVLKSLKRMSEEQETCCFDKVVLTVPALFELPQSKATAEAARLAGFDKVELLPEPVASGLATGWGGNQIGKAWLVYDLGGGTFDVSLLESRDGLLRVVGHDGDNFLGGRDIDRTIVTWITEYLQDQCQLNLTPKQDDYASVMRHFEAAAELAKIRLSSTPQSVIELEFGYDGQDYELDINISREKLKQLCEPLVQRSIDICKRLIKSQGLDPDCLERVVLVGGPAQMPIIQELVTKQLAPLAQSNQNPMSLVSQGAAIYAATINLACSAKTAEGSKPQNHQVWLQYPSICAELNPTIMGRIIDNDIQPGFVKLIKTDKSWESLEIEIDDSGIFTVEVSIKPGSKNGFEIIAFDKDRIVMPLSHQTIKIVHGLTMSDPPLSRSIGVALADGSVKTFIERGAPLPAKRTFMQSTVETLLPGSGQKLEIPIVQGERRQSRFCRKVGNLVIDSNELKHILDVGSAVEITIEVDRGGDLKAYALLPDHGKLIEGVAHLVMACSSPEVLRASSYNLNTRLSSCLQLAFREQDEAAIETMNPLAVQMQNILKDLINIENDMDACQRISRNLMEIEAEIEFIESKKVLAGLAEECESAYFSTSSVVKDFGDATERRILQDCAKQLDLALQQPRQSELERLIERLNQLSHSAHEKSPDHWKDAFLHWASLVHVAKKPRRANAIVTKGRAAIKNGEHESLKALTLELYELIPQQHKSQGGVGNYGSGVY